MCDSMAQWSSCRLLAQWRMNGLSLSELCCLFCCPPCPSRIAAKLAFLPPEPTYAFLPDPDAGPAAQAATGTSSLRARSGASVAGAVEGRWKLHLTERAEFQYTQRELDTTEVFLTRSSRGNRVGCMYIRCVPNARWVVWKIYLPSEPVWSQPVIDSLQLVWPFLFILWVCHTSSEAFPLFPFLSVFYLHPGLLPSLVSLLTQPTQDFLFLLFYWSLPFTLTVPFSFHSRFSIWFCPSSE